MLGVKCAPSLSGTGYDKNPLIFTCHGWGLLPLCRSPLSLSNNALSTAHAISLRTVALSGFRHDNSDKLLALSCKIGFQKVVSFLIRPSSCCNVFALSNDALCNLQLMHNVSYRSFVCQPIIPRALD